MEAVPYIALALSAGTTIYSMTLNYDTKPNDAGSLVNKSGTQATRDVVYGRCLTGAVKLYSNVNDNNSSQRLDVFSLGIAVSAIHQVFIDEVSVLRNVGSYVETTDTNSLIFSGSQLKNGFDKQCSVQLRTGMPNGGVYRNGLSVGIPMQLAMDNSDGEWTNKMRGDYTALVAVKSKRIIDDESIRIMADSYSMNAEVSGVPVYDPRFGNDPSIKQYKHSSAVGAIYRECGRNPALAALDYITNTYYGLGIPFDKIDTQSFIDSANWCDTKGFKVDGQLSQGNSFASNIDSICKSAGLSAIIINGKLHLMYQDVALPSHSFDYDNILDGSLKVREQSSGEYINAIEVKYKNSELLDKQDVSVMPENIYPDNTSPDYPSQPQIDGFLEQGSLDLPMVRFAGVDINDNNSQIRYFANRELARQQFQKEVEFDIDLSEDPVNIFDVVEISNDEFGWDKKQFRIISMMSRFTDDEYNVVSVIAKEHDNAIYNGTLTGTQPSEKPTESVIVTAPVDLVFTQYNTGSKSPAVLTWQRTYYGSESEFIVEYKKSSSATWTSLGRVSNTSYTFPQLPADVYDFRVATWSNLYGSSDFVELLDQEISAIGVLPPVTGTVANFDSSTLIVEWNDMLNETVVLPLSNVADSPKNPIVKDYFSHYKVDVYHNGAFKKSYTTTANLFAYTFEQNKKNGLSRNIRVDVSIVATDTSKSQITSGSTVNAVNSQHKALTGFTNKGGELSVITLSWDTSSESDYLSTTVRRKKGVNGSYEYFTVAGTFYADVLPEDANVGETFYYNVAARDVFDNNNLNWSNEVIAIKKTIDDLQPNFHDELKDIRNPDFALAENELIFNVTNQNKDKVVGFGMYAPDAAQESTKFIVAADEFVIAVGGYAEWDAAKTYAIGERCTLTLSADVQQLYEAVEESTNSYPYLNGKWELVMDNTFKSAFYFNSVDEKLYLDQAVIGNIDAGSITTGTLDADRIAGNSIEGEKIKSSTTIQVGNIKTIEEYELDLPNISLGQATANVVKHFHDTGASTTDGTGYWYAGVVYNLNGVNYGSMEDGTLEYSTDIPQAYVRQVFTTIQDDYSIGEIIGVKNPDGSTTYSGFRNRYSYIQIDNDDNLTDILYLYVEETGQRCTLYREPNISYLYYCEDPLFVLSNDGQSFTLTISENPVFFDIYKPDQESVLFLNGDDTLSNKRLWAGNENPELANVSIDGEGILRAKGAIIDGTINATDGTFSGRLSGADFSGEYINGTEINASLFKAGTIIASTIYASDTELLADPYNDGTPTYYVNYPTIPVSVQPIVSNGLSRSLDWNPQYQRFNLRSAADKWGEISESRAREMTIPANTFRLTLDNIRYFDRDQKWRTVGSIDWGDLVLSVRHVNEETGEIISSGSSIISQGSASINGVKTINTQVSLANINWNCSGRIEHGIDHSLYTLKYLLEDLVVYSSATTFGDINTEELNGVYEISLHLTQSKINFVDGSIYLTTNEIYGKKVNIRTYLNNEA